MPCLPSNSGAYIRQEHPESLIRSFCTMRSLRRAAEIFIGPHQHQTTERTSLPCSLLLRLAGHEPDLSGGRTFSTPAPDRNGAHKSLMFTGSQGVVIARSLCGLFIGSDY